MSIKHNIYICYVILLSLPGPVSDAAKESVSVSGQAPLALLPQSAEVGPRLKRCHAQTSNNAPEGGGGRE